MARVRPEDSRRVPLGVEMTISRFCDMKSSRWSRKAAGFGVSVTLRSSLVFFVFVTVFAVVWLRLVRVVEVVFGRVRPREEAAEGDVLRAAGRRGARRELISFILKVSACPVPSARAYTCRSLFRLQRRLAGIYRQSSFLQACFHVA